MFSDEDGPMMEVADTEQKRRLFLKGMSGNPKGRAAISERAQKLFSLMAADFGALSAVDTVLLNQACLLLARSERVHRVRDIDVGLRMSGEARRLLSSLRKPSARRPESELQEYLRATHGEATEAPAGTPEAAAAGETAAHASEAMGGDFRPSKRPSDGGARREAGDDFTASSVA
jgi:hypothetical protein